MLEARVYLPGCSHGGVFQELPRSRLNVQVATAPFGVAVEGKPRECGPCWEPCGLPCSPAGMGTASSNPLHRPGQAGTAETQSSTQLCGNGSSFKVKSCRSRWPCSRALASTQKCVFHGFPCPKLRQSPTCSVPAPHWAHSTQQMR